MQYHVNETDRRSWRDGAPESFRRMAEAGDVLFRLRQCPAYAATPLADMTSLASALGIRRLSIKDETRRMGLGSFKALGGAYAVFNYLMRKTPQRDDMPARDLLARLSAAASGMTFCCASAGNHGLSVAAGAKLFGAGCTVFLAETVPEDFAKRLREHNAAVIRHGADYEQSIAGARKAAQENNWVLIADSSWEGYTEIPAEVMKGYSVIGDEIAKNCADAGEWPSHVFLQAGVGGLAGALANHIRLHWTEQPAIVVVEPEHAACLMESARRGRMSRIEAPGTNMGRLDCAEPSLLAFEILKNTADIFVTVDDQSADIAAKTLSRAGIETTPAGAAGYAALANFIADARKAEIFDLGAEAYCLVIATETVLQPD